MVETMAALFGTDADSFRRSPLALVGSPGDKAHEFAPLVASLTGT